VRRQLIGSQKGEKEIVQQPAGRIFHLEGALGTTRLGAYRVGGIPAMIEDGVTGVLFDPGSSVALACCLRELLENGERRDCMGQKARELARARYSPERVAHHTVEAYRQVVGSS
jgi:glycosyltransferase involved in cell wall biosynthesis